MRRAQHTVQKVVEVNLIVPSTETGEPQRVDGTRRNTPPTAFCFESYAVNTGEPGRDVKEGGQ